MEALGVGTGWTITTLEKSFSLSFLACNTR